MATGVDNIALDACAPKGIHVGHTPDVLIEGTVDLTMVLILSIAKRIFQANQDAREGRWTAWSPIGWLGVDLNRSTLGITGMGRLDRFHPLYKLPDCMITPHIGSAIINTRRKIAELARKILLAGLNGKRFLHFANPEVYDNKILWNYC